MIETLKKSILGHKLVIVVITILIAGGGYYWYSKSKSSSGEIRYVLAQAEKGTLIESVSGTGQVSSRNQLEIKPKVSGDVISVKVKQGDKVKAGQVIAILDTSDLQTQVKQAKISLDIARANLDVKLAGVTADDVRVAKNSIESAKIAYQTSLSSLESVKTDNQMSLEKAQLQLQTSQDAVQDAQKQYDNTLASTNITSDNSNLSVVNAYKDAQNTINSTLITLRSALLSADSILGNDRTSLITNDSYLGALNSGTLNQAQNSYLQAKASLNSLNSEYSAASVNWHQNETDKLLQDMITTLRLMEELEHDVYGALQNTITGVDLSQTSLDGYKQTISGQESAMISSINSINTTIRSITSAKSGLSSSEITTSSSADNAKSSLETAKNNLTTARNNLIQTQRDNKKSIESAQNDVKNKKISLDNAQASYNIKVAPPRAVDIASLKAQIYQADNSYQQALQDLKDAEVVSPIDGVIAVLDASVGLSANSSNSVSSASTIATIITEQKIAEISLNEVDAAKVKVGQKVTLTFNAIDGLSITGSVAEVDAIGTVAQGVVSYGVKIAFDTQDQRIKSEMSVSAEIITNVKQNILLVPSTAIKTQGDNSYVQILGATSTEGNANASNGAGITSKIAPTDQVVVIGDSNDSMTQIVDGVKEGDMVVTKTIDTSVKTTTAANTSGGRSGFNILGGGGPGR